MSASGAGVVVRRGEPPFWSTRLSPRARFVALVIAVIAIGLFARALACALKTDFHVDEGITLALTNGSWKPPVIEGLFDRWMDKGELEELAFNANLRARGVDYAVLSRSTAADVHPPLYYWLFASVRVLVGPERHRLACFVLNGLLYAMSSMALALTILRGCAGESARGDGSGNGTGRRAALAALIVFSLMPAAIAFTSFMRMYELLQFACAAFLCACAFIVLPGNPRSSDARPSGRARAFGLLVLFFSAFVGTLTQYYFIFFAAGASLAGLIVLARRGEVSILLWSILAVACGAYAAYRSFPDMAIQLLASDRAREGASLASGAAADGARAFGRVTGYLALVVANLTPLIPALALALYGRARRGSTSTEGGRGSMDFIVLLAIPCAVVCAVAAFTAPLFSFRYLAPIVPASVALLTCLAIGRPLGHDSGQDPGRDRVEASSRGRMGLPGKTRSLDRARAYVLGALALSMTLMLLVGLPSFHEDYATDRSPPYFRDDLPIIVASNRQGFAWKNLLPYLAVPDRKRVYVTMRYDGVGLDRSFDGTLASSGSTAAYVMVDALFPSQPSMDCVGFYGFFAVYRIGASPE